MFVPFVVDSDWKFGHWVIGLFGDFFGAGDVVGGSDRSAPIPAFPLSREEEDTGCSCVLSGK